VAAHVITTATAVELAHIATRPHTDVQWVSIVALDVKSTLTVMLTVQCVSIRPLELPELADPNVEGNALFALIAVTPQVVETVWPTNALRADLAIRHAPPASNAVTTLQIFA